MKKLVSISAIVLTMFMNAQEAGKVGELLRNEATATEMQSVRKPSEGNRNSDLGTQRKAGEVIDNSDYHKTRNLGKASRIKNKNVQYRWNNTYGYSEVFLRIPERGYFTVEIGDQMMATNSGKFRFFDLMPGRIPISIFEDGYLIYKTRISVQNNKRIVLDFFTREGLYLLDSYPVQNQTYGFNDWDDVWNTPYGNQGNHGGFYGNNQGYFGNVMDDRRFQQFIQALQKNTFESSKQEFLRTQIRDTQFTSRQIFGLLKEFTFERDRLEVAKMLFPVCVDKSNFYVVYDAFTFDSSKQKLMKYISNS